VGGGTIVIPGYTGVGTIRGGMTAVELCCPPVEAVILELEALESRTEFGPGIEGRTDIVQKTRAGQRLGANGPPGSGLVSLQNYYAESRSGKHGSRNQPVGP
jgi:hypothetical protein